MFSKSLIQFSIQGRGFAPFLLLGLRPNCSGGNEDNGNLLQKAPCMHCCTECPQPCIRPPLNSRLCWTLLDTHGQVWVSFTSPFSWVLLHTMFCLCPPRVCFPVLCKFWWFFGGVNGDLLQEGFCHTQVCCTWSPSGRPLPTRTSTEDTQTQFWLSMLLFPVPSLHSK